MGGAAFVLAMLLAMTRAYHQSHVRPRDGHQSHVRPHDGHQSHVRPHDGHQSHVRPHDGHQSHVRPRDGHQSHVAMHPPRSCVHVPRNQTQETYLRCNIPPDTVWKFVWIQKWANEHVQNGLNVYIKCESNSSIILRQPVKAHLLQRLEISSCDVRQMHDYDLSAETEAMPFTIRTMVIEDSVYFITFNELLSKFTTDSQDIISKYPCYLPPSIEEYVERNVSVKTEGSGTKKQYRELQKAAPIHKFKLPQCEYRKLKYYEKSYSQRNKYNFIRTFLDKSKLPSLQVLNISYLQLDSVPSKLFREHWPDEFPALTILDLSHNNLPYIPFTFPPRSRTMTVNMTWNNISIINESALRQLESFYPGIVLLQDNPLWCTCKQRHLLRFVHQSVKRHVQRYDYMKNMTCKSPVVVHGRKMGDVTYQEICQEESVSVEHIPKYVFFITLPIFLLLIIVIVIFFRYRKELKMLAFTRLTLRGRKTRRQDDVKKEYDAFVSYSCHDELLVSRMCTRLEGPPYHFSLCLHYREFVPGACISENIIKSVETSCHTILILSKHFMESEWCILEFRKAFQQSLLECKKHLIVVLLEDFKDVCLPTDLMYYLQTYTYLSVNEYLFWDKLVFALSDKRIHGDTRPVNGAGKYTKKWHSCLKERREQKANSTPLCSN